MIYNGLRNCAKTAFTSHLVFAYLPQVMVSQSLRNRKDGKYGE